MKKIILAFIFASSSMASTYVTYNIGLAHSFVKYAKERTPHIIDVLKKENADLYCIQEAWRPEDRDKIIESLKKEYPYTYYVDPQEKLASKSPVCGFFELMGKEGFARCVIRECIGDGGDKLTECVLNRCRRPMLKLIASNQECALALMANVGGSPLHAFASIFNPFSKAPLFAYGGSNGLLLISKKKLEKKGMIDHSDLSTLNRRATLYAQVDGKKVYCTHLTANLGGSGFYAGTNGSWEQENRLQIERILQKVVNEKLPLLMMGDFNCSIGKRSVRSDFASNCQKFLDAGFSDHYFLDPECSFCQDNTLVTEPADFLLDHIFTKGISVNKSIRVFSEKVQLDSIEKRQNISDHFGILIDI